MARLNTQLLRKQIIETVLKDTKTDKKVSDYAKEYFQEKKLELLQEFDEHPISEEISQGVNGSNTSNTLEGLGLGKHSNDEGYEPNLFTFIGFEADSNPVGELRAELQRQIRFANIPTKSRNGNQIKYNFGVFGPSHGDISHSSPMPFGTKASWPDSIEQGVPNINSYIYWKNAGRSSGGILAKEKGGALKEIRQGAFYRPVGYLTIMLANFKAKF